MPVVGRSADWAMLPDQATRSYGLRVPLIRNPAIACRRQMRIHGHPIMIVGNMLPSELPGRNFHVVRLLSQLALIVARRGKRKHLFDIVSGADPEKTLPNSVLTTKQLRSFFARRSATED
jgi:hypothetical protein